MTLDRTELELQAKLQVKVGRTLLRAKLIMLGNALLVAWLASLVLLLVWWGVYVGGGSDWIVKLVGTQFGLDTAAFTKLNLYAMALWKMAAYLLLLCPGLGLRACGEVMKP